MRRKLFTFAAAISTILLTATVVLWVRSYRLSDDLMWVGAGGQRSVWSGRGYVAVFLLSADWKGRPAGFHGLTYARGDARAPIDLLDDLSQESGDVDESWQRGDGFAWHERRNGGLGVRYIFAVAPFWGVAAATAVLPLGWAALRWRSRLRARRRTRRGLCPACGYDVRATPGRCPECGTPVIAEGVTA